MKKAGDPVGNVEMYFKSAGPIPAIHHAVELLWLTKIPEDEDTENLRKQLLHLKNTGMFDYDL